jgi:MYXO-CTERM domain-containing protein
LLTAVTGQPAEADVEFVSAPQLRKSFAEPRVAPGDSVTLEFELGHGENAPSDATAISFTDDLNAMLSGLEAVGLPLVDVCGSGSRLEGTSLLTFTGGTLEPLESCTFDVTVTVPAAAESQSYTNTTSEVSATVSGLSVLGEAAVASLEVTSVVLEKEFLQDPSFAGDTVPLRFTITNDSPDQPATDMFFTDNLDGVLSGLAAVGLPEADVCGPGSSINGTTFLIFTGGNLPVGGSCTFDVDVQIPSDAESSTYTNVTSAFGFTSGGVSSSTSGASAALSVGEPLSFEKAFDADEVAPGSTVNLEFTIANAHPTLTADQLSFDDDLTAVLEGLQAVGLPLSDVCGEGSMLTGPDVITLTGGAVAPASSCSFSVELQVPDDVGMGTSIVNETSVLTGLVGDFARTAPEARDELAFNLVSLAKQFEGPAEQGGSTMLTFTVENLNATAATGVSFTDDLDAVLPGLAASGTPAEDVCGEGSTLDGTGVLALRNGSLDAGGSCTFSVSVEVPLAANPGDYENVTSTVSTDGGAAGGAANATLTVVPRSIEDGGVDGGTDGGVDGGTGGGSGGGCGCRTTAASEVPVWLLAGVLVMLWRRRRTRRPFGP